MGAVSGDEHRSTEASSAVAAVRGSYIKVREKEINTLAIDDKWFAPIQGLIQGEVNRVTRRVSERVRQGEERYSTTMPEVVGSVETLGARVEQHLRKMGVVWA